MPKSNESILVKVFLITGGCLMDCYYCSVLTTLAVVVCLTNTLISATNAHSQSTICNTLHLHYRVLEGFSSSVVVCQ